MPPESEIENAIFYTIIIITVIIIKMLWLFYYPAIF